MYTRTYAYAYKRTLPRRRWREGRADRADAIIPSPARPCGLSAMRRIPSRIKGRKYCAALIPILHCFAGVQLRFGFPVMPRIEFARHTNGAAYHTIVKTPSRFGRSTGEFVRSRTYFAISSRAFHSTGAIAPRSLAIASWGRRGEKTFTATARRCARTRLFSQGKKTF